MEVAGEHVGWQRRCEAMVHRIEREAVRTGVPPAPARFDPRVLRAMRKIPRHEFVPACEKDYAYSNCPLPIGHGQTISQPYVVALMTHLLELGEADVVLEIGTGSGYQAAVLAEIALRVCGVELVGVLAERARLCLLRLGYRNVEVCCADGHRGWPGGGEFDGVIVTAAAPEIPPALLDQLKPGRKLVAPLERRSGAQDLVVVEKDFAGKTQRRFIIPVAFVPLVAGCDEAPPS